MATGRSGCTAPGAVSADDLLAYVRGEAQQAIGEHVQRCEACRARGAEYAEAERALAGAFFRRSCPPSITIGEYALGALPGDEAGAVAQHLFECPHCAEERRGFSSFLAERDDPELREGVVARTLRRLFARPLGPPMVAAGALRGDEDGGTTSFAIEGYQLIVGVQRPARGSGRVVVGLLQQGFEEAAGISAHLFSGEHLLQSATVDDLGNFILDNVQSGEYRLELGLPDAVVVVEPLRVS